MPAHSIRRSAIALVTSIITAFLIAGTASAGSSGGGGGSADRSKIKLQLDDRKVPLGDAVTGALLLRTKGHGSPAPIAGATVSVEVDGVEVGTVTTDDQGRAEVSYTASEAGRFKMRVAYAGDESRSGADKAKKFRVVDDKGEGKGDNGDKGEHAHTKLSLGMEDDEEIFVGDQIQAKVRLRDHSHGRRDRASSGPRGAIAGATVTILVDGAEVTTVTTDDEGKATFTIDATSEGQHQLEAVYAGDADHAPAHEAKSFEVSPAP